MIPVGTVRWFANAMGFEHQSAMSAVLRLAHRRAMGFFLRGDGMLRDPSEDAVFLSETIHPFEVALNRFQRWIDDENIKFWLDGRDGWPVKWPWPKP